jgi:hypothetical protein
MAAGYNAAQVVAEDAGVRDQTWWNSKPYEWYSQNLDRLLTPLGIDSEAFAEGAR